MRGGLLVGLPRRPARLAVRLARVLVLVAVDAQQLLVRAVGPVVVVVAVLVVHRELAQPRARELARAAGADPGQDLERPLAIGVVAGHGGSVRPDAAPVSRTA